MKLISIFMLYLKYILLHINVKCYIGLSATLLYDNYVIKRVHKVVYAEKNIYINIEINRYIDVYAIAYTISNSILKYSKTTNYGLSAYSYIAFVQSITKRKFILKNYIEIIETTIDNYFIVYYKEKNKLFIFVSIINLTIILVEKLSSI